MKDYTLYIAAAYALTAAALFGITWQSLRSWRRASKNAAESPPENNNA